MHSEAGALLVAAGLITQSQLRQVLQETLQSEGTLSQHLVRLGFISANDLAQFYSARFQIPLAQHDQLNQLPPFITSLVPSDVVKTYRMIPIMLEQGVLHMAMSDPSNRLALEEVSFLSGYTAVPVAAADDQIETALAKYYPVQGPELNPAVGRSEIVQSEADELEELFRPEKEEAIFYLTKLKSRKEPLASSITPVASSIDDAIRLGIQEQPDSPTPATFEAEPAPTDDVVQLSHPTTKPRPQPSVPAPVLTEPAAPQARATQASADPESVYSEQPRLPSASAAPQHSVPAPLSSQALAIPTTIATAEPSVPAPLSSQELPMPTTMATPEPPVPASLSSREPPLATPAGALSPPGSTPVGTDKHQRVEHQQPESIAQSTADSRLSRPTSPELASAIIRINQARQRDEIASILIHFAQRLLRRSILFAVRKNILVGWMGSCPTLTNEKVKTIIIPLNTDSEFRVVCENQTDFLGSFAQGTIADIFLSALGKIQPKQILLIPICVRHKPVFLLYGDCGMDLGFRGNLNELNDLAHHAAAALEQIILVQKSNKKSS